MDEILTEPVIAAVIAAIALLASGFLTHRLTVHRDDRADQRAVQREAASALTEALQSMRRIVDHSATQPVRLQSVLEAASSWETVYRKYATRVPKQGRHVRQSVAIALGEHFGAAGWSNIFPGVVDFAVSDHDPQWWDNADSYLSYLVDRFSRWYDDPHTAHKLQILDFDTWLANRNRLFS